MNGTNTNAAACECNRSKNIIQSFIFLYNLFIVIRQFTETSWYNLDSRSATPVLKRLQTGDVFVVLADGGGWGRWLGTQLRESVHLVSYPLNRRDSPQWIWAKQLKVKKTHLTLVYTDKVKLKWRFEVLTVFYCTMAAQFRTPLMVTNWRWILPQNQNFKSIQKRRKN